MPLPVALTIAGSDPGGGAGLQADLKTFHSLGVYGTSAVTLITVQNTTRFSRVLNLPASIVREQIEVVLEDLPPGAIKTGALGTAQIVRAVASLSFKCPLVIDPVIIGKHGPRLIGRSALETLRESLLPRAALVTPNLHEAAELTGLTVGTIDEMKTAAIALLALGPAAVLIKGGHLQGDAVDILFNGEQLIELAAPRVDTRHTHGTGCTYSAAITAFLALGHSLEEAVREAKTFVTAAIRTAPGIGSGAGPLNHWASV